MYNKYLFNLKSNGILRMIRARVCDPRDSGKAAGFCNYSRTTFSVGSAGRTNILARRDGLTELVLSWKQHKSQILPREDPPSIQISSLFLSVPSAS